MFMYIYIYIYTGIVLRIGLIGPRRLLRLGSPVVSGNRGVQWKQGVVICILRCPSLLHIILRIHPNPLHPLPLHPPL